MCAGLAWVAGLGRGVLLAGIVGGGAAGLMAQQSNTAPVQTVTPSTVGTGAGAPAAEGPVIQTSPNGPLVPQASKTDTPQAPTGVGGAAKSQGTSNVTQGTTGVVKQSSNEPVVAQESALATTEWELQGLTISGIRFDGVGFAENDPLARSIREQVGKPLDPQTVRESVRKLYGTGRYRDIGVSGIRTGDAVTLIFTGTSRYYVGRVEIFGVKNDRLSSLLEYSTNLNPGTAFTPAAVGTATDLILQTLAQNGYYQPDVQAKTVADDVNQQMNVSFTIKIGVQARIGKVTLAGSDPGLTMEEFRKKAKLKQRQKVTRETTSNALTRLRNVYQKKDRLEATVALEKSTYDSPTKQLNYDFNANQGPVVKVSIEGIKIATSRVHLLVPVFEEGTVDNDLLNEGLFNIRDFLQRQGYFDATVTYKVEGAGSANESIVYSVDKGAKHKVIAVTLHGNKYFQTDLLKERMQVQKADAYLRSGRYSSTLLTSDVSSIESLYRANGFNDAKVTTSVQDVDKAPNGKPLKFAAIHVLLTIDEGQQQRFGTVALNGVDASRMQNVKALLNAQSGQPFSLITLSGDRDVVLSYYLSNGFEQAHIDIKQNKDAADPTKTDVSLNVTEGHQVFIKNVVISGDDRTKPRVVQSVLKVKAGDPLDQTALLETQRALYNLALFNEVNAAVQNPTGEAAQKNVLVQLTEAKRWDVTYGFGFEASTGTPSEGQISKASQIQLGLPPGQTYTQNGKAGVSPRVSLDISRINLFGTDKSLTLHTTYGLLETVATLSFNNPHLLGFKNLTGSLSGGYSNVQNISTFQSTTSQGDIRVTQKFRRTDTFIYDFEYRRVAVNAATLQVSANLIPQLSEPVRVGGPGITWFHDTRQPSPLDATKGSYTSISEFYAGAKFGSQVSFNRVDGTNSTYYSFGKRKYTFARNTRIGYENAYSANPNASNTECAGVLLTTNASCNAVPLPERLYAGGATSHRGFAINGAGPRDLQTGFPVGGSAVFVNSFEMRFPAPTLPYVGDNIAFVLFHDMGNVFQNPSQMFPSFLRFHQPNEQTCANVSGSIGTCNFNYFSHAIGSGARYKTPVGPIRVDFSYNLNPPKYPVIYDFNGSTPYEGQASHFNFFFSIGQSF
jgi:outer membrane protein assembly factor BamA